MAFGRCDGSGVLRPPCRGACRQRPPRGCWPDATAQPPGGSGRCWRYRRTPLDGPGRARPPGRSRERPTARAGSARGSCRRPSPSDRRRLTRPASSRALRWWASRFDGMPSVRPSSEGWRRWSARRSTIRRRFTSPRAACTFARRASASFCSLFIDSSLTERLRGVKMCVVPSHRPPLARRLLAEFLGTGLLVAVVVGSGIAAQQLSPATSGCSCSRTAPPPCSASACSSCCSARSPERTSTRWSRSRTGSWAAAARHGMSLTEVGAYSARPGRRGGRRLRAGQRHVRGRHLRLHDRPGHAAGTCSPRWSPPPSSSR